MLKLWINTIGREFYAQHAALLLFIFYIVFGAAPARQVLIAITSEISSAPLANFIFFLLIVLYALKCLHFVERKISSPSYNFVHLSTITKKKIQLQNWLWLYSVLLLPILFYTTLIIFIGIYYKYYWSMAAVALYILLVLAALVASTYQSINYTFKPVKHDTLIPHIKIKRPYWTWSIYYLLEKQTLMFVACKVLSFILFKGIIWIFADIKNDIRVYLTAILITILVHSILIATVLRFEQSKLSFTNSLPIKSWSRLLHICIFLIVLFIPEIILYLTKVGFYASAILNGILFCMGGLFTLRMALYLTGDEMDRYLKIIFIFFLVATFAILTDLYLIFSLSMLILNTIYYQYLYYKNKL